MKYGSTGTSKWVNSIGELISTFLTSSSAFLSNLKSAFGVTHVQVRTLPSNITSDATDIASFRLDNVVIGEVYKLTLNTQFINGSATGQLRAKMNGTTFIRSQNKVDGAGNEDRSSTGTSVIFTAIASTITFDYLEHDTSATLEGNGTTAESFVMLEEKFNYKFTTKFTPS